MSSTGVPRLVPAARAATMPTPGAEISGFSDPPLLPGPRLEKSATLSSLSTAPTVSAFAARPGDRTVPAAGPAFPAAMTNRVPYCSLSRLTAWLRTSLGVPSPPRLMLMTSAPCAAAHSIPASTHEESPEPLLLRTFPTIRSAPGATPLRSPPEAAPEPAMVAATCVPCPCLSGTVSVGTKLSEAEILPARSGWSRSAPVSRTATFTPLPSYPAAQASGAPICGTLFSRSGLTCWSSHTFVISRAAFAGWSSPVPSASKNAAVSFLPSEVAAASMEVRGRALASARVSVRVSSVRAEGSSP